MVKAANDNGLGVPPGELEYRVRMSFANLLRVIRGVGKQDRVLADLEGIAAITKPTAGDYIKRTETLNRVVDGLLSWHPDGHVYGHRASLEQSICEASLRLVAARLDGNQMQEGKAQADFWGSISAAWEDRENARETARQEELQGYIHSAVQREARLASARTANDNIVGIAGNAGCYVYFVTDGEAIKIGKANNPRSRLSGLQTSHHKDLAILALTPGDETLERELHRAFHVRRLRGEWFEDCPEIRALIDDINSGRYAASAGRKAA